MWKPVLSPASVTVALPGGQPVPLTVSTSTVTLPGGGAISPAAAAGAGPDDIAAAATAAQPATTSRIARVTWMADIRTLLEWCLEIIHPAPTAGRRDLA